MQPARRGGNWLGLLLSFAAVQRAVHVYGAESVSVTTFFEGASCRSPISSSGPAVPLRGTGLNCSSPELSHNASLGKCLAAPLPGLSRTSTCAAGPLVVPPQARNNTIWATATVFGDAECTQPLSNISFSHSNSRGKHCVPLGSLAGTGRQTPYATFFCYPAPHYEPFPPGSGMVFLYNDSSCRHLVAGQAGLTLRYWDLSSPNDSAPHCQAIDGLGGFSGYCGLAMRRGRPDGGGVFLNPGTLMAANTTENNGTSTMTTSTTQSATTSTVARPRVAFATYEVPRTTPVESAGVQRRASFGLINAMLVASSLVGFIA
ncbi:hypothetical protein DFJ74DRAFT_653926 [Hyaloraphidium curvatum]|nr:hypothetical protein DFJ74DRAFT_653926 [Hyaloraphidium curvatum]